MQRSMISVVLPCFNAKATLRASIESVRSQTFEDWDLIVFDDGSTDGSPDLAREIASEDPRIRVIASSHVGIVQALQRGCAEAHAPFIARMDADDVAHPERLARQLALMRAMPEAGICGTQVRMAGRDVGSGRRRYETWVNGLVSHEAMARELFVECPIPHPTFLMRREIFEAAGGYEERGWAEDYDLCMRFFLAGARFGKVDAPLLDWTERPNRLSMVDARYSPENFRALKRHYLLRSYLADRQTFYQWGAGEVGKRWLREWGAQAPAAVVDINPRKIGRAVHGFKVVAPEDLPAPGAAFIVVAVGAPNAREEIREWLAARGYVELEHYLFLA